MNPIIPATILIASSLTACGGDNPFSDTTPIKDTDYAQIRIEIQRCSHISEEGSFTTSLRNAPRTACLNHLKSRIVQTGNKVSKEEMLE
jgi:hypothetical protein